MRQNETYKKMGKQLFWIVLMETNIVMPLSTTIYFNVEEHNENVDINANPMNPILKIMDFCLQRWKHIMITPFGVVLGLILWYLQYNCSKSMVILGINFDFWTLQQLFL